MQPINVKQKLSETRNRRVAERPETAVVEALHILNDAYGRERDIALRLSDDQVKGKGFSWAKLQPERIYALEDIKKICIDYRLRFLDSSKFKGAIPYEAICEIKAIENNVGADLTDFAIMAPDDMFRLEDCDKDPLLFLKLSENYYYLVHQWGGDLAWYRKLMMWPMRSFYTLITTVAMVSLALALVVPTKMLLGEAAAQSGYATLALFFWFLVSITSVVTYIGFAFFKNVTVNQWNSPFFKQEF
jgi:hypothetical protein